ncbi:hypothetical protein C0J52_21475, partial [Blattella germanica]
ILKKAVPPKRNLCVSENQALKVLKENTNVVVLPADKGNAAVVMSSAIYHENITALLENEAYRPLSRNPTGKVERLTSTLLAKSGLPNEVTKQLRPHSSIPPRNHGLPKIHKESVPLRPIANSIGSPTYSLAKDITGLLQPLVGTCIHHVRNSMDFIETLKGITISSSDVLVSFDVESLFTRIQLKETLDFYATISTITSSASSTMISLLRTSYTMESITNRRMEWLWGLLRPRQWKISTCRNLNIWSSEQRQKLRRIFSDMWMTLSWSGHMGKKVF